MRKLLLAVLLLASSAHAEMFNYTGDINLINLAKQQDSIIYYYVDWCPSCRKMHKTINSINNDYEATIIRVDCEKYKTQCSRAGIKSFPTTFIYKGGQYDRKVVGYNTYDEFTNILDE